MFKLKIFRPPETKTDLSLMDKIELARVYSEETGEGREGGRELGVTKAKKG